MSLDNIQLPPVTVASLFRKSLVDLKSEQTAEQNNPAPPFAILGKNKKGILIIVQNNEAAFLPDEELNFLLGVLGACKLNMEDVGIINIAQSAQADYKTISGNVQAGKLFLFGIGAGDIQLPLAFPHYQVQQYNKQVYLSAPSLQELQNDRAEKTKLWNCLKQIFSI